MTANTLSAGLETQFAVRNRSLAVESRMTLQAQFTPFASYE